MTPEPIYRQVLGAASANLGPELAALHYGSGERRFRGYCTIEPARSLLMKCLCFLTGLPVRAAQGEFIFELVQTAGSERWTRYFPTGTMRTVLTIRDDRLEERLGFTTLTYALSHDQGKLSMHVLNIALLGIRLPHRWLPTITATEQGSDGRFLFDVGASWGIFGQLVRYSGWLDMSSQS
jgi:hypothetical protein